MTDATWAAGVSIRPAKEDEVVVEGTGYIETYYEYSYYATFDEAKACLLEILGHSGLDAVKHRLPKSYIRDLAGATMALMMMVEADITDEDLRICDIQDLVAFFIKKGEVNEKDHEVDLKLVADHRKCTPDFCFGAVPSEN